VDAPERAAVVEELHRRFAGVLYDKCVRVLGDRTEAEDAVQETFVSAFRALGRFEDTGRGHLPWLYRIATNVCIKLIRTRRRKGAEPLGEHDPPAATADPAAALDTRALLDRLAHEVDDRTLEILVAHYVDGVDQGQIAEQYGISRRAVVKRLTALRARAGALLRGAELDG
jgi:RNA polymerase sigma-70 factor (ECF subfamily)